jgi:hypothetical protein
VVPSSTPKLQHSSGGPYNLKTDPELHPPITQQPLGWFTLDLMEKKAFSLANTLVKIVLIVHSLPKR